MSGRFTIQELSRKHEIHPNQISQWKTHFLENAEQIFDKGEEKQGNKIDETEKLYKVIGQQKVEIDFLKKVSKELGL